MRTIKFRAWHKNEMVIGCHINNGVLSVMENPSEKYDREPVIIGGDQYYYSWATYKDYPNSPLMQFTGQEDINGNEIFEGDILHQLDPCSFEPRIVRYCEHSGAFVCDGHLSFQAIRRDELVIIGNIHQNPELLIDKKVSNNG